MKNLPLQKKRQLLDLARIEEKANPDEGDQIAREVGQTVREAGQIVREVGQIAHEAGRTVREVGQIVRGADQADQIVREAGSEDHKKVNVLASMNCECIFHIINRI